MARKLCSAAASAFFLASSLGLAFGQEDLTIKLSNTFQENHFLWVQGGKVFVDAVDKATKGKVKFETYHANQLGKDQVSVLTSGLAQIAVIVSQYSPDKLPLTGVTELPGITSSSCEGTGRLWQLAKKGGVLDKDEYEKLGLHVLFITVPPPYKLMTAKTEVTKLEAISGLKVRTVGGAQGDTVRALGAVSVQVQASELYDSLSRGTVDGMSYVFVGMPSFSLGQVIGHSVEGAPMGSSAVLYAISKKAWEGLPDDVKTALNEAAAEAQEHLCNYQDTAENSIRDGFVKDYGLKVHTIAPEEAGRWKEKMAPVAESWAKKLDEQGRPGTEILKAFSATASK